MFNTGCVQFIKNVKIHTLVERAGRRGHSEVHGCDHFGL